MSLFKANSLRFFVLQQTQSVNLYAAGLCDSYAPKVEASYWMLSKLVYTCVNTLDFIKHAWIPITNNSCCCSYAEGIGSP